MIPDRRAAFNAAFTAERYRTFVDDVARRTGAAIDFRLSETPGFFPQAIIDDLTGASLAMIADLLGDPAYRRAAAGVVPDRFRVARGETLPTFVQVDFGLVRLGDRVEGRLVELQAFPSLYGFQLMLAEASREVWRLAGLSIFPSGLDRAGYLDAVGKAVTGDHDPAEVVLMEIDPLRQKTRPDFTATERLWGVRTVDARAVRRAGGRLFADIDGRSITIRRVYNRVIPDQLEREEIALPFDYRDDLDVEWAGGPDWFFRVSKFSLPFLRHPWVPRTVFLHEVAHLPDDRDNWILKPLFSYAGGGITFAPTDADVDAIPVDRRHEFVLQERVAFTPVIGTPQGATQAELRLMFVRSGDQYRFVLPLVRMGRGRMMGVDHNRGLAWVGAAAALIA